MIQSLFRSLRHRNFRLFFSGQLVSLTGTWMQNVGQAWLVLELTQSPLKLGIVSALQFAPMLILSFPAGVLIDYFPKRKIIIAAQSVMMLLAFTLALLDWSGLVRYWHVTVLAAVLGIANTVDVPARQSFIIEMVGRQDLMNAIALNSSVFNAARAVGPAVAGLLIGAFGTAACFSVNGLSYLAVIIGLARMQLTTVPARRLHLSKIAGEIGEGLGYIRNNRHILVTILLVAVVGVFATNFSVLVPVFVRQELHRDAAAFGLLLSSFGLGALFGAAALALRSGQEPGLPSLLAAGTALSLVLVLIGLQNSYAVTALLLGFAGWSMVTFFGLANTLVQLNSENHLRGRVMSVYTFTFGGLTPFGSLLAGAVADWIRAPLTFALGGLITGIVFLGIILKRKMISAGK